MAIFMPPIIFMLQLNFNPFPELQTERLVLREISADDVAQIFQLRSNKNLMHFIQRPIAKTEQDALKLIEIITTSLKNNEAITWAVTLKNKPALIGTVGFWRVEKEHYRAEIGYMLSDAFHRQGLMQEAIIEVLRYGFNAMHLHSVEANVNPANVASSKLLEKIGFVLEANFKENYYYDGNFFDSYIYSLLASKFKA